MQTVKFARVRLARFAAVRVYSYSTITTKTGFALRKRAGVYGKGH